VVIYVVNLLGKETAPAVIENQIWGYLEWSVLVLVVSLELFSIVATNTHILDRIAILAAASRRDRPPRDRMGRKNGILSLPGYIFNRFTGWLKKESHRMELLLLIFTYIISLTMNNLAAIIVITPISLRVGILLGFKDLERFVVFQVIVSNLGGASVLIGDFPNIFIATHTGASFIDFLLNLGTFILVLTIGTLVIYYLLSRRNSEKSLTVEEHARRKIGEGILTISQKSIDIWMSIVVGVLFIAMILIFILFPRIEPAFVAAALALMLLIVVSLIRSYREEEILNKVNFRTLLTFALLFLLAGVVKDLGLTQIAINKMTSLPQVASLLAMMWTTGISTGILSAGPSTLTFLPLAEAVNTNVPGNLAFWALSLGVLAGSSASALGATAGPVAAGIYERFFAGYKRTFSFLRFLKIGVPIMLSYLVLSTFYIFIRLMLMK